MSTTTLSIDKATRDLAAKRAKEERISVSVVARMLLREYGEGKISLNSTLSDVHVSHVEIVEVDDEFQTLIDSVSKAWDERKSVGK